MQDTFIGIGNNPDGPDLPLGFGAQLEQDPKALEAFGRLTSGQKSELIGSIQGAATGAEAKHRMAEALRRLQSGL